MAQKRNTKVRGPVLPPELEQAIGTMLKAAVVMPDAQGVKHVEKQAGLLFDQYHEAIPVAERRLRDAEATLKRATTHQENLRRELAKLDDLGVGGTDDKEDTHD